jgi:hypothetical protein
LRSVEVLEFGVQCCARPMTRLKMLDPRLPHFPIQTCPRISKTIQSDLSDALNNFEP